MIPVTGQLTFFQSLRRPFFLTCLCSTVSFSHYFPLCHTSLSTSTVFPFSSTSSLAPSTVSHSSPRATWLTKVHPTAWAGRSRIKLTASTTLSWRWSWWSGLTVSVVPVWESQNPESWVSRPGWKTELWVHLAFWQTVFFLEIAFRLMIFVCLVFSFFHLIWPDPERADQQSVFWRQAREEDPELTHGLQTNGADLPVSECCREVWRHQDWHVPDCGPLGRSGSQSNSSFK